MRRQTDIFMPVCRGARDQQGGIAVHQRRAHDRQPRTRAV